MGLAAGNISLPETLLAEIRIAAEAQNRTADELAADAIRQYLKEQSQYPEEQSRIQFSNAMSAGQGIWASRKAMWIA